MIIFNNKRKNVFISQPMSGISYKEINKVRDEILNQLKEKYPKNEITEINSLFCGNIVKRPLLCLAESLKLMANADIIVFAHGWENARGCKIEHTCAKEYLKAEIIEL